MKKYLAYTLYALGCAAGWLAWTDNPASRRWEWPYSIYNRLMGMSADVQGDGGGPWEGRV